MEYNKASELLTPYSATDFSIYLEIRDLLSRWLGKKKKKKILYIEIHRQEEQKAECEKIHQEGDEEKKRMAELYLAENIFPTVEEIEGTYISKKILLKINYFAGNTKQEKSKNLNSLYQEFVAKLTPNWNQQNFDKIKMW
jgi:hypothetical protein